MNFLGRILMVGGYVNSDWGRQHIQLMAPELCAFETETAQYNTDVVFLKEPNTRTGSGEDKYCHGCLVHRAKKAGGEQLPGKMITMIRIPLLVH